jgi:cellulose biosynthesis protein BcsQ
MQNNWRPILKRNIEERYIHNPQKEWYRFRLNASGILNITIVSDCFTHLPLPERNEQIRKLLQESNAPTRTGFLALLALDEAGRGGPSKPPARQESIIDNWSDLARAAMNSSEYPKAQRRKPRIPHAVTFYSFKSGVGRTTALIHVAWLLAMRGRKVVAVDLDLEAPSLSALPNLIPMPKYGITDYFYERSHKPRSIEPDILIGDIFGEVRIPNAPGRLFVVPSGSLSLDYMTTMDGLSAFTVTEHGEDLWSVFFREITEQLQPDIILVDARTGISEWGAFSLLRAANQAIMFLYPDEQNKRGIELLLEALTDTIPLQLVFSPVPSGGAGEERVRECWQALRKHLKETQLDIAEPITVPYHTELALAQSYPVLPLLPNYMPIANVVDESYHKNRACASLVP